MPRGTFIISLSRVAFELLCLLGEGKTIREARKLMGQTYQQQTQTINQLKRTDCIFGIGKGRYIITEFGEYLINKLQSRRYGHNSKSDQN